jgi:uncharacterized DUF497 family protein
VKPINWDPEKSKKLKDSRGVSFEEISILIENREIVAIVSNPNQVRYPDQKLILVLIDSYIHCVPFVEDEEKIFLKTIFASRKYHKKYYKK